jgi:DNA-binding MarR family transcriptional regulator
MPSRTKNDSNSSGQAPKNQDLVRQFAWEVASLHVYFQEIRQFWAKSLGISGPQWMILMAVADLDEGAGVSVKVLSKMIHVDPSFVTTQSKLLEKKGLLRRKTSSDDARFVQMSLTDKTYKHISSLASRQQSLNEFIFAEFSDQDLKATTERLASLKKRLEKACQKIALDL